ncbi:monoacylglycerol/Diacylglycerol O-acyltransferase isoform X2 [Meriones unguiculatus]|uniref:transmembrane protein 68 isoform X2 n=1 Tax=Psammomys obesus TaxID=48139 RepID=UPI002453240A|nr:transmembrane protein 68 isoform X2 [Psammomys obesus]XP_060241913.1 monoacylglycerol/Diacylglycerol O-acyltransferase isoform X2 [Meriones unguiculatus]
MIDTNQTCTAGQDSVPYLTCMIHVLEEWLGVEQLEDYLNFANHLLWVFTPLILLILPYFTIFLLYLTIIFLHIYKRKNVLKEAYSHNLWDGARKTVATLWDGHAAVWHGFSLLLDVFCALHGPREKCVEILRSGHLLAISPGGVREALLSDETYNIIWGNRKGFAQVAIDAKVPIIPMFTQNIREGFRSLGGTRLFKWLYEKFRYPFAPMYGGFPVKLRTYLGDPIPYDPNITAEELAEKTKNAVQALIDKHQRIPGNIRSALLERFHREQKTN